MKLKQILKITLLIIILAEEIRSVKKTRLKDFTYTLHIDTSELIEQIKNLKNSLNIIK